MTDEERREAAETLLQLLRHRTWVMERQLDVMALIVALDEKRSPHADEFRKDLERLNQEDARVSHAIDELHCAVLGRYPATCGSPRSLN